MVTVEAEVEAEDSIEISVLVAGSGQETARDSSGNNHRILMACVKTQFSSLDCLQTRIMNKSRRILASLGRLNATRNLACP